MLRDRDGDELNDDGTRKCDNWFRQQRDIANFTAFDRRMEAEQREREEKDERFRKLFER